jgi:hypothetical protein
MRKQGSLFSTVVNYINTIPAGQTYKVADLIKETRGAEEITWWKSRTDEAYRTRLYQGYLRSLGFLENVKRGEWKVVAHIPEWLNSGVVNCAKGYKETYNDTSSLKWCSLIMTYLDKQQAEQDLETEIEKHNNMKGPQPGEAITTIQCMDPMTACIELRKIGVLAVPVNLGEIEIHVINKAACEDLAFWLINNGFDDLDEFPELEDMLRPFFPASSEFETCESKKVYLTVLNYADRNVDVYKVESDEVYEFLEETYGVGYDDFTEYMTSDELKLNIDC